MTEINSIKNSITIVLNEAKNLSDKINLINDIRLHIHNLSPFKNEPVDYVSWVRSDSVVANDYNPNRVAPPEMELLELSIINDGYTQPIVTFKNEDKIEVVDGFHRNRVGKESKVVSNRIMGFLPVVSIRNEHGEKGDRIASTIRHNRARGKHVVDAMSEIVIELKNRNWKNERIARELGMDEEEILRLCQITGLADLFKDDDFSKSWKIEDSSEDFEPLYDEITDEEKKENGFRTINTDDKNRIFHTYDKWECYIAGFYNTHKDGMTKEQCEIEFANFLKNDSLFRETLNKVITEWKHSCEHYLTNKAMNRLAWLGQASVCYATGIPQTFRGGYFLLTEEEKDIANKTAYEFLNKWLLLNGYEQVTFEDAISDGRQVEIY